MHSLDINFLSDRSDRPVEGPARSRSGSGGTEELRPLFFGIGAAVAALALVGGAFLFANIQKGGLEKRQAELDSELAELQRKLQEVETVKAQTAAIQEEINSLVTVFNRIRPWSAMLQDGRERIPEQVQIETVSQVEALPPPNAPPEAANAEADPSSVGGIEIAGFACSFDDVNDFLLTLQRSPFLKGTDTRLVSADLQDSTEEGRCPGSNPGTPLQLVKYTIQSNITDIPASELLQEFERKGTIGLVARIEALKQTGVFEP
ncbi:MAG: hypothetical protein F6K19_01320 [Cyanothece sp. SIO1E1]|nr:hypothetical protein [Cyanothece sp. SIO1E1]